MSAQVFTHRRILALSGVVAAVGMAIAAPAALAANTAQSLPGGALPSQCSSLPDGGFVATSSTGGIACSGISKLSWDTRTKTMTAVCPAAYPYNEAEYQYINNTDSGYWQNNAPTLANWGGTGSTNWLTSVTSSVGNTSKPGSLSLEIYHFALDTNHVQDFTSCTSQPPSI